MGVKHEFEIARFGFTWQENPSGVKELNRPQ